MTDFPSIAFQSSLGTEAILFGVFGFLYSVFAMYTTLVTLANPDRPPIMNKLRQVCRIVAVLIVVNAFVTVDSLVDLNVLNLGLGNIVLGVVLALTVIAVAVVSVAWAFWYMN